VNQHLRNRGAIENFNFEGSLQYNAALSGITGSTGAFVIPPETLMTALEVNMLAFGAVRRIAGQILTSSGEPFSWPTADDTSNEGRMIPENTTADDNNGAGSAGDGGPNPSFGKTTWGAYKFTSDTCSCPTS
jgi:HK97 family phage major capsid protein